MSETTVRYSDPYLECDECGAVEHELARLGEWHGCDRAGVLRLRGTLTDPRPVSPEAARCTLCGEPEVYHNNESDHGFTTAPREAAPPRATTSRCPAMNRDGYDCELTAGHRGTLHRALIDARDEQGVVPEVRWREIADGVVEPWSCEASCVGGGYPALCYMYPDESHAGCPRSPLAGSPPTPPEPSPESGALLDAYNERVTVHVLVVERIIKSPSLEESREALRAARAAVDRRLSTLERDAARMREQVRDYQARMIGAGAMLCEPVSSKNLREAKALLTPAYHDAATAMKAARALSQSGSSEDAPR